MYVARFNLGSHTAFLLHAPPSFAHTGALTSCIFHKVFTGVLSLEQTCAGVLAGGLIEARTVARVLSRALYPL